MSLKFDSRADAEKKKSDVGRNQIDNYRDKEKIKAHSEHVLDSLDSEGSWQTANEIYSIYEQKVDSPLHRNTIVNVLNDFRKIGEIERKGNTKKAKYRKVDKPIKSTREGFNSQSEDVPDWISERIQKVVDKKVERKLDQAIDRVLDSKAKEFREMVLAQDEKIKQQVLEESKNDRQDLLIEIIEEHEPIRSKRLYRKFYNLAEYEQKPTERTLRKYLRDLLDKGLIDKEGSGRWREYKTS